MIDDTVLFLQLYVVFGDRIGTMILHISHETHHNTLHYTSLHTVYPVHGHTMWRLQPCPLLQQPFPEGSIFFPRKKKSCHSAKPSTIGGCPAKSTKNSCFSSFWKIRVFKLWGVGSVFIKKFSRTAACFSWQSLRNGMVLVVALWSDPGTLAQGSQAVRCSVVSEADIVCYTLDLPK